MLTQAEIAHFRDEGFVVVNEVLTAAELDGLIKATEDPVIQQDLELRQANERIAHLLELTTKHVVFRELARDPRLTKRVASLIGDDLQLQHSKLATKPCRVGAGAFSWHQDFARYPHPNYDLVAVTLMLD